jgi:hypothetical protein
MDFRRRCETIEKPMRLWFLFLFTVMATMRIAVGEEPLPSAEAIAALADKSELIVVATLTDDCHGPWFGSGPIKGERVAQASNTGELRVQSVLKGTKPALATFSVLMPMQEVVTLFPAGQPPKPIAAATLSPEAVAKRDGIGSSHVFFLRRFNGIRETWVDKAGKQMEKVICEWETFDGSPQMYPNDPKLIEALKKHLLPP